MELVINEENLQISEIQEYCSKVRAILINKDNKILIANYGNVILLPGGKVDAGETNSIAITRELSEEIGRNYNSEELDFFATLSHYQKDYPKRDGTLKNRLVQTHYYIGSYKGIQNREQKLTEKEKRGNFRLELVSIEELENRILNNINNNPRNIYFQIELLTILTNYKKMKKNNPKKVRQRKEINYT